MFTAVNKQQKVLRVKFLTHKLGFEWALSRTGERIGWFIRKMHSTFRRLGWPMLRIYKSVIYIGIGSGMVA